MLHMLSTVVLLLLAAGIFNRRTPRLHIRYMLSAFALDCSLVLYIELSRGAVEKVSETTNWLLWFHVTASVIVLALYLAMIMLGYQLFRGNSALRSWHARLGIAFCAFRLLNYSTSFILT